MNKARLLKLAEHLERGELGHDQFDFSLVTFGPTKPNGCGSNGCAIGELPMVFDEWKYQCDGSIRRLSFNGKSTEYGPWEDVESFFDIDSDASDHLFLPEEQNVAAFGGEYLEVDATRQQVAFNIRAFVKKMESK